MNRFPDALRRGKVIGRSLLRLEDEPLLLGQGRFADDIGFAVVIQIRDDHLITAFQACGDGVLGEAGGRCGVEHAAENQKCGVAQASV